MKEKRTDIAPYRLEAVSRSFGAIKAVDAVSFDIRVGAVHGLCGHNGAGKSTVVKLLTGQLPLDSGQLLIDGEPVEFRSPQDAQRYGVAFVDQELSVVPVLSVSDNIALGGISESFVRRPARARVRARELLDRVGLAGVDPGDLLADLSIGQRQQVEIARALGREARLLILDEPTATLSSVEIDHVFEAIRSVTEAGCAVIYVSHRLDEVMAICGQVTVLRDGRVVDTVERESIDTSQLVSMMLGEPHSTSSRQTGVTRDSGSTLQIEHLQAGALDGEFALTARGGRICALAGQVGSGASDVLRAVAGLHPEARGTVHLDGRPLPLGSPHASARAGVAYVSNDRKGEGLFLGQSVRQNLVATRLSELSTGGVIGRGRVEDSAAALAEAIKLSRDRVDEPVERLSGGNQQKVLLGRSLNRAGTRTLLLDDPTRGVDVRGRAEIHGLIRGAAEEGIVVVFTSTELEEILDLGDEIVTMRAGRVVARRDCADANPHILLGDMTRGVSGVAA